MSDYGTMRTRIADEMANDGDITASHINNAIRTAIRHYEREPFWFNQKVGTFVTVAAQEYYGSADLADIPNMVRIDVLDTGAGGTKARLRGMDNASIDDVQDGSVTGEPEFYSRYEDKIRLFPIPNGVFTVTARYVTKFAALVSDGDSNAWVNECEELIRQAAKRIICTDILHDDAMAGRFASLERAAHDRLRKENRTRSPQSLRADLPFGKGHVEYLRLVS